MKIILKDGSQIEVPQKSSAYDCAMQISAGLARNALACEINGVVRELTTVLQDGDQLNLLTFSDKKGKEVFWHTSSSCISTGSKKIVP